MKANWHASEPFLGDPPGSSYPTLVAYLPAAKSLCSFEDDTEAQTHTRSPKAASNGSRSLCGVCYVNRRVRFKHRNQYLHICVTRSTLPRTYLVGWPRSWQQIQSIHQIPPSLSQPCYPE